MKRAVVLVVLGAVMATTALLTRPAGPPAASVIRYERHIEPIVTEWGRIEVQGMRPAVGDLTSAGRDDALAATVAAQARAWTSALLALRDRLDAVRPPRTLRSAGRSFDRALTLYVDAARVFEAAATAGVDLQAALVDRGIRSAQAGARVYNHASAVLQRARRHAGLGPTPMFPDRPAA